MNTIILWLYRLISLILPESRCYGIKNALLRIAGAKIGRNVRIYSSVHIIGNGTLEIEDDVHIGPETLIYPVKGASIHIGSHVDIGPKVILIVGSHKIETSGEHIGGDGTVASLVISDGCWIGASATILPGITLPPKTLVAAGAVVHTSPTKKNAKSILLAGVPATIKKIYV